MTPELLFLTGCMGSRYGITYLTKNMSNNNLKMAGYVALIPAIAFLYLYLIPNSDFRTKSDAQLEWADKKVWWNYLRPIHGILWLIFAIMAINGHHDAWKILFLDTTLGLVMFCVDGGKV